MLTCRTCKAARKEPPTPRRRGGTALCAIEQPRRHHATAPGGSLGAGAFRLKTGTQSRGELGHNRPRWRGESREAPRCCVSRPS